MSSVSQQPQIPQATSNNSSASQSTLSYASTAKKAVSSPPVATGSSSTPSPAVAVGGAAPVQHQHGKSISISPVNGKNSITPAVPAVSAPAIAHSSSAANGGSTNHSRKSSVTINANGPSSMNGGPVGGAKGSIQFGSITDSPAATHSTPHVAQPPSAPIAIPNPRVSDPASSPSPIPQPLPSGGRPPSGLGTQGNNVAFGSFGGDGDRHMRQSSNTQAPLAPSSQQPSHIRRDSSQSTDVSNQGTNQGRGGYPQQGGRGRGYNPQSQYQQQLGFPPPNQAFGRAQGQGRGGIPTFQGQGRQMPYPNSPHQANRSPAITPSMPGGPSTPNMNPAMPMQNQQQFNGYYPQQHMQQNFYPGNGQYDPRGMPMQGAPMYYPQMQNMGYNMQPPQSPQPGYQQPNAYVPGQYAPQPAPMSRNSSQMSEHRPASSMGQPQTPSMAPAVSHTPQPKAAAPASTTFSRPTRKSAAILIKRPDGEALDLENLKASQPASPATSARTRTPPVIASTPTPPPKPSTPLHTRNDSAVAAKSSEQVRLEMMEKVKKLAEGKENLEKQAKADGAAKAAEIKLQEEEKAKADAKAAEEAKATAEAEAKAAADKAKQDEEDELERQIQEMEAADAEREKKEAELSAKRAAEKAVAEKAKAEQRKKDAEENDRKLREQEREMERLEDEKEKKRAAAEAKAQGGDKAEEASKALKEDDKTAPNTPTTLASKLSGLSINEGGVSPSTSNDSMGPPPKINTAEKRTKPPALNLAPLNTKPIEPPQPSAALMSLKSARFLTVMNSSLYPPNISSPNPALNSAVTTKGKSFKYDKEFLLQFQKVFIEKPSVEFESQIKALIGDGDGGSARSASTRGPNGGSMGSRQNSTRNNNAPGSFAMGNFGAVGGKTLPPGTTSEMRFAMASGSMPRPAINPMASFNRPGGAFPGGNAMTRTPSTTMPNSPRQGSRQGGGRGSKTANYQGSTNKHQEAQQAKTMPLTAGMDLKPIQVSATGWKPRSIGTSQSATGAAGPTPGASGAPGHMEPDLVQRKVKAALNKMTPEKFDKIADQILTIAAQSKDEADGRTLRQVIQLTFEKATDEAHWASMYAKFCKRMLETMDPNIKDESILDRNGNVVSGGNLFRKYLLNRCQEEFERGWKMDLPDKPEGERGEEKTEEAVMLSDEYYVAAAAKRRGLGLVQFIGELYKLSMLTERIMHECVKKLVDYTGIPDEAEIESLTKLLKTIGANLDNTDKGKPMMDVYFSRIQSTVDTPDLPSRLRFMLMDIIDLRKKRWASKEDNKGPKTLDEVRIEAEAVAAQKAADNARAPRGGGGGRMQMGRGDSRNFSNQYNNQPPVDYQKNTVGMDDLRRLTNKNANRASSQQMSFGPTSMFSSRSNSGRKMGPGGALNRTGDDSGPSSRTGTPPQQKEKDATSVNAFSLLAGLGSGEPENPASPPSTSVSPALSKASPATAGKSDEKEGS